MSGAVPMVAQTYDTARCPRRGASARKGVQNVRQCVGYLSRRKVCRFRGNTVVSGPLNIRQLFGGWMTVTNFC